MTEQAELLPVTTAEAKERVSVRSSAGLDDLGLRLNRRERELVKALNDMACAADDDVPLFWFKRVFTGWMAPQSDDRKARVRFVLDAAIEAHNEASNAALCEVAEKGKQP